MTKSKNDMFSVAEIKISYRGKRPIDKRPVVYNSRMAYEVLLKARDMNKIELVEQFGILLLDKANSCIGFANLATGSMDKAIVDPRIIYAAAIKGWADSIIMTHNHPSDNPRPSDQDKNLTTPFRGSAVHPLFCLT